MAMIGNKVIDIVRNYEVQELFGKAAKPGQKVDLSDREKPYNISDLKQEINVAGAYAFMKYVSKKGLEDKALSVDELANSFVDTGVASATNEAKKLIPKTIGISVFYQWGTNFVITKKKDNYHINIWMP